jgi:hypothetical protein
VAAATSGREQVAVSRSDERVDRLAALYKPKIAHARIQFVDTVAVAQTRPDRRARTGSVRRVESVTRRWEWCEGSRTGGGRGRRGIPRATCATSR